MCLRINRCVQAAWIYCVSKITPRATGILTSAEVGLSTYDRQGDASWLHNLFISIVGGAAEVERAGGRRAGSAAERQREPTGETPAAPGAAAAGGFPDARDATSTWRRSCVLWLAASSLSLLERFSVSTSWCPWLISTTSLTGSLICWLSLLGPTSSSPTLSLVAFGLLRIWSLLCKSGCGGGGAAEQMSHSLKRAAHTTFRSSKEEFLKLMHLWETCRKFQVGCF